MRFHQYLAERNITPAEAGEQLGYTAECIRLWKQGQRIPRPDAMAKVQKWSDGEVTPADWYESEAA